MYLPIFLYYVGMCARNFPMSVDWLRTPSKTLTIITSSYVPDAPALISSQYKIILFYYIIFTFFKKYQDYQASLQS